MTDYQVLSPVINGASILQTFNPQYLTTSTLLNVQYYKRKWQTFHSSWPRNLKKDFNDTTGKYVMGITTRACGTVTM